MRNGFDIAEKAIILICDNYFVEDLSKSDEKEETKKEYEDGKGAKKTDDSEVI